MNPTHWSIPRRLVCCLGLLFLLLLLMGLQACWQANALRRELASLVDDSLPSMMVLNQLDSLRQGDLIHLLEFVEARTPERRAEIGRRMATAHAAFADTMARAEALLADAEERRLLDEFKRARAGFLAAFNQMKELSPQENRPPTGEWAGAAGLLPKFSAAQQSLQSLVRYHENLGLAAGRSGKEHAMGGVRRITWTLTGSLVLTILLAWMGVRSVRRSLDRISGSLEQGARHTASAARQVASASRALSSGASEQASSVEETSTSLEEVSSMIQATAENAQRAKALASETRAVAEMSSRRRSEVSEVMAAMDDSNSQVAKIVKNIDEIAFQTNILALNAAVEAARAGEAGAGFAVVADEVRSLAQRSAAAARETAEKIELAIASSRRGAQLSQLVGESLGQIAEKMAATDVLVGEIAAAAREQAQGIEQINQAIGQMDRVTQGTASSAEETAAAAEQMDAQAGCLNDQVDQLRQLVGARPGTGTAGPGHRARATRDGRIRRPATLTATPGRPRAIPMPDDRPSPDSRPF